MAGNHFIKWQILSLLFIGMACSQVNFAVINDQDGFVNVRSGPGKEHPVIYRIKKDELFEIAWDNDKAAEWTKVNFLVETAGLHYFRPQCEGYVHRSRVKPLAFTTFQNRDSFSLEYVLLPYKTSECSALLGEYHGDQTRSQLYLNGSIAYGLESVLEDKTTSIMKWADTDFKLSVVDAIKVNYKGEKIEIPQAYYRHLFDLDNDVHYEKAGDFIVASSWGGDGGSGYEANWIFRKGEFIGLYVFVP